MKLISLQIAGYKNLDIWDSPIDFTRSGGVSLFVGNNGSGKSNLLEAISAIFYGLHTQDNIPFDFAISYQITDDTNNARVIKISQQLSVDTSVTLEVDDGSVIINQVVDHLPSKVIALYSGEETRLYTTYYKSGYDTFVDEIIDNNITEPFMSFISKDHREIALLLLLYRNHDLSEMLGAGTAISYLTYNTNSDKIRAYLSSKPTSRVNQLAKQLEDGGGSIPYDAFQDMFYSVDLYPILVGLLLHKNPDQRLITDLTIYFENGYTSSDLSEGQKKQLLLKFSVDVLANNQSLIIRDEPDAHLHVGNKDKVDQLLSYYKEEGSTGEVLIATHSPTLMQSAGEENIFHLENGTIVETNKAEVLRQISGGKMSYTQQQIVLNTNKDILIVEGKTDEKHIRTALEKLKPLNGEYENLDFEFVYMGGTDHDVLCKFSEQFPHKEGQTIVAFFDRDEAGYTCIKKALGGDNLDKENFPGETLGSIFVSFYPKKEGFTKSNFEIEDYFPIEKCRDFQFGSIETFEDLKNKFKKNNFADEVSRAFEVEDFEGFKKLFDRILEIKGRGEER